MRSTIETLLGAFALSMLLAVVAGTMKGAAIRSNSNSIPYKRALSYWAGRVIEIIAAAIACISSVMLFLLLIVHFFGD